MPLPPIEESILCAECGFSQILALKIKPVIAKKAKENLSTHTADGYQGCQNSDKAPIDTKKEVAKLAGVSHDTIAKVETIEEQATPEIKEALRADSKHMETQGVYMDFEISRLLTLSRLYTPNSFSSRRGFYKFFSGKLKFSVPIFSTYLLAGLVPCKWEHSAGGDFGKIRNVSDFHQCPILGRVSFSSFKGSK